MFDVFCVFGQRFERVTWRFAEGFVSFLYAGLSRHRGERRMFLVYSGKGMTGSFGHLRRLFLMQVCPRQAEVHVGRFRVRAGARDADGGPCV